MSTCCGPRFYCVSGAGPTAVSPGADGWYSPPTGWTAGPFGSITQAAACCPYYVVECGDVTFQVPALVTVVLENFTGDLVGRFDTDTVTFEVRESTPGYFGGYTTLTDTEGTVWAIYLFAACGQQSISMDCALGSMWAVVKVHPISGTDTTCIFADGDVTDTPAAGWTAVSGAGDPGVYTCRASGEDIIEDGEQVVNTLTFACPSLTGSMDVRVITP